MERWRVPSALLAAVCAGCGGGTTATTPTTGARAPTPAGTLSTAFPVASEQGELRLPESCSLARVEARLRALAADVTSGDGSAVAANFLATSRFRWEVYEHLDPPNGVKGALQTSDDVESFVHDIHSKGTVWSFRAAVPPVGAAGLPQTAVYGLDLMVRSGGRERAAGAKVVVDCASGLIGHMVGPSAD
jgi:hypothetical protein